MLNRNNIHPNDLKDNPEDDPYYQTQKKINFKKRLKINPIFQLLGGILMLILFFLLANIKWPF